MIFELRNVLNNGDFSRRTLDSDILDFIMSEGVDGVCEGSGTQF
jgi:hypothetical protein